MLHHHKCCLISLLFCRKLILSFVQSSIYAQVINCSINLISSSVTLLVLTDKMLLVIQNYSVILNYFLSDIISCNHKKMASKSKVKDNFVNVFILLIFQKLNTYEVFCIYWELFDCLATRISILLYAPFPDTLVFQASRKITLSIPKEF